LYRSYPKEKEVACKAVKLSQPKKIDITKISIPAKMPAQILVPFRLWINPFAKVRFMLR
jgi:hypothetical protein